MGSPAQPLIDTLNNLEHKYNPAEWLKSTPKKNDSSKYQMNWKPEANDEQKAAIKKQGATLKTSTGGNKPSATSKKRVTPKKSTTKRVSGK